MRTESRRAAIVRSSVFPPNDCAISSGATDTASLELAMVRLAAERAWRAGHLRTAPGFGGGLATLSPARLRARAQRAQALRLSRTGLHINRETGVASLEIPGRCTQRFVILVGSEQGPSEDTAPRRTGRSTKRTR